MARPAMQGNMTVRPTCASVLSACLRVRSNNNETLTGAALAVSVFAFFLRFFGYSYCFDAFYYYPCASKREPICSC